MNAARRMAKRREWPRGLREPRPGYYTWDHPDGRCLVIGRVPLAVAKNEALQANQFVIAQRPGLLDRIAGAGNTVTALLAKMPPAENANTAKALRSLDKIIADKLGRVLCASLTVAQCAELVEAIADDGKARSAQAVRSRLVAMCRRGQELGWMDSNPAEVTRRQAVEVKRGRLSLDQFLAIRDKAPEVAEWLALAMNLALVTGADRVTISRLERRDIGPDALTISRSKTGALLEIPLVIRLEAVGLTLADLVKHRTGVVSRHLVHHISPWGNAPAGAPVFPDRISKAFTAARVLAGIPDEVDGKGAPTFHEIRSLSKRLYDAQGNVDTKQLLGHRDDKTAALYADERSRKPVRVRVG